MYELAGVERKAWEGLQGSAGGKILSLGHATRGKVFSLARDS
jgi:hypothetical protein